MISREVRLVERLRQFSRDGLVGFLALELADAAIDVVVAEVEDAEAQQFRLAGDLRGESAAGPTASLAVPASNACADRPGSRCSRETSRLSAYDLEQRADRVMGADLLPGPSCAGLTNFS